MDLESVMEKRANTSHNQGIMKLLRECLERLSKDHQEGCIEWATMVEGNIWDSCFKEMERSLLQDSDGLVRRKLLWFEKTLSTEMDRYKKISEVRKKAGL